MKKIFLFITFLLITVNCYSATITITIPNAQLNRILDAFARKFNYKTGSETKNDFARRMIVNFIVNVVHDVELNDLVATQQDVDLGPQ